MQARSVPMHDVSGRSVLVTIAKIAYHVDASGIVSLAEGVPIRMADEPSSDTANASPRYPSDLAAHKPGTDVVFVGTAYPRPGRAVTEQLVSVRVGPVAKTVRVFGTRVLQASLLGGVAPGPAQPLTPTPLVYELAQGGTDPDEPNAFDPRNPVGIGFARSRATLEGRPAHRLEVPRGGGREPAGFGPIPAHWSPRRELAGTFDEAWRTTRAPFAPADADGHHACVAHPDLWSAEPLAGDEPVEVLGATPEGAWRFRLPRHHPSFRARVNGVEQWLETHLDTYLVDGDARRVELTWRAAIAIPRKSDFLERVTIFADGDPPDAAARTAGVHPAARGSATEETT